MRHFFRNNKNNISLVVAFFAGIFFFWLLGLFEPVRVASGRALREHQDANSLINPLLLCDSSETRALTELVPIRKEIQRSINNEIWVGDAKKISVYFRDLMVGGWTGVNENETYDPASLLKVPLMIAYFKEAESRPDILNEKLVYTGKDYNVGENIKPEQVIQTGNAYSVSELIHAMIVYSDNNAFLALYHNIDERSLVETYSDLGLSVSPGGQVSTISPKQYALFFRILYNGTYLWRSNSEKALELLVEATYDQGITRPLPADRKVAHKFGERGLVNEAKELHDCGIVYDLEHPYLLCIMTEGSDVGNLSKAIQAISKTVYEYRQ